MILLADQPPRVNQLHVLALFVLLALCLLPADSYTSISDSPVDGDTVYTLCAAARTAQAGGMLHAPLMPVAGCAFVILTLSQRSEIFKAAGNTSLSHLAPLMILRL